MTFEDAIAALGAEFGVELSGEGGTAGFEVASEDGDFEPVDVTLTYEPEDDMLLVSVDVGAVDPEDGDEPLLKMLEANHMFSGTMGTTASPNCSAASASTPSGARAERPF